MRRLKLCGSACQGERLRVKVRGGKSVLKRKRFELRVCCLRTTSSVVARKGETDECARETKDVMGEWEEKNDENKGESVEFGMEESEDVRILGS